MMSRFLSFVFFGFVFLGILAESDAQVVRKGTLRDSDRARLAEVGGDAAKSWVVFAQAPSGAVTRILGSVELAGAGYEARTADFLARLGPVFDLATSGPGAIEIGAPRVLSRHDDGSARHVRIQQMVRGFEAPNCGITIEYNKSGRAVCIHGIVSKDLAALPAPAVGEAAAVAAGIARLRQAGHEPADFYAPPKVDKRVAFRFEERPVLAYRVGAVLKRGGRPLVVDVDAATGKPLQLFENKETFLGEGSFKHDAQTATFTTGNGKGVAYKDFNSATANVASLQTLPELGFETAVVNVAENGELFGRFSWILTEVFDSNLQDFFISTVPGFNHQFLGFPSAVDAEAADFFDATNCYLHLTKYALGMTKLAKQTLPTDFSMPTIVNEPQFQPQDFNAFFSSSDIGFGTGPGFMLFGDPSWATGTLADDFSRDPSVMCHEYTHAIADFAGLGFSFGPSNIPNRAVNEALADYFAASFFKDPRIGLPLSQLCSPGLSTVMGFTSDGLRNLAAPKTMFDNLLDVTVGGIPEEHAAGHIFGCTLWNVRVVLKQKLADQLILGSIFNWPQDITEIGYVTFGAGNAIDAYADYYEACLSQLVNDAVGLKGVSTGLKTLGAVMRNGCIGMPELATGMVLDLSGGGTVKTASSFLGNSDGHLLGVGLTNGQTMDVTLAGDVKDNTIVDLLFAGPGGGLSFPNAPTTTANSISIKGIEVNQSAVYTLNLLNDGLKSFAEHRYKLTVKVK